MKRTKKLKMNSITSLLNRIAIIISGLILPRYILLYFGSEVNGLVASINQFLGIVTFLDLGIGSVVQSALYKPLADNDDKQISMIYKAAGNYFRKIAYILVIYVFVLILFYPYIIGESSFSFLATTFLVFALSISKFAQYYLGIVNEILLNADQKGYIQLTSEIVMVILNLIASVVLITQGFSIQIVKFASGLIYLIRPIYLTYYINKHYSIDLDVEITGDPLPQKWGGVGQHIAYTIQNSTDITVLTLFSTLENVSIYSVYNMVVRAIRLLFTSLTAGMTPFFGDLLANEEHELLNNYFSKIEWLLHTTVTFLFGMTAILINTFVLIYTSGVYDVDYNAPGFSAILVMGYAMYSIRTPYRMLVFSAGHFKETQKSSFIEAGINILISLVFVNYLGLVGVALGTLASMTYQTLYIVDYLSKNIINRPKKIFLKHLLVDALIFGTMIFIGTRIISLASINTLSEWVFIAAIIGIIYALFSLFINYLFFREPLKYYSNMIIKKIKF